MLVGALPLARTDAVDEIGMTPASGGEIDELLEPVWSGPERTMPANTIGEGMPRQPSRAATLRS
jgi:hypothetical protein